MWEGVLRPEWEEMVVRSKKSSASPTFHSLDLLYPLPRVASRLSRIHMLQSSPAVVGHRLVSRDSHLEGPRGRHGHLFRGPCPATGQRYGRLGCCVDPRDRWIVRRAVAGPRSVTTCPEAEEVWQSDSCEHRGGRTYGRPPLLLSDANSTTHPPTTKGTPPTQRRPGRVRVIAHSLR